MAYADFVTAMMALFMVLWISTQDEKILIATSRYFQSPFTSPLNASSGILEKDTSRITSPTQAGAQDPDAVPPPNTEARNIDLKFLESLAKDFYRLLHLDESLEEKPIDVQVTSDGLRITLFDRTRKPLFKDGGTEFTAWGDFVMQNVSWMIDRHRFQVVIEGHARKGLPETRPDYTAWELTTDRANATRRALTHYAVDPSLIQRVTGYADTRPLPLTPEDSESNQRVTLSLSLAASRRGMRGNGSEPADTAPVQPPVSP